MRFVLVLLGALLALPMPAEAARPGHHHSVSARHGKKRHKHRRHHRKHGRKKHHRHRSTEL